MIRKWENLPRFMQIPEVRPYWEILWKRRRQIRLKRIFDFILAVLLLVLLAMPMLIIAVCIKIDSKGPVLFRQERITSYGHKFKIHKFRSMVNNAESIGSTVTVENDSRITKMGKYLRKLRLDELPQLIDVLQGTMSFVGTRPEAVKYVRKYNAEYYATLLLPAGITSEASIRYKDENILLDGAINVDKVYLTRVLPDKMKWNLNSIERFSFLRDVLTMFRTVAAVLGKKYT